MEDFDDLMFSNDIDDDKSLLPFANGDQGRNSNAIAVIVSSAALVILLCICCKSRTRPLSTEEADEQEKQDKLEDPEYRRHLINRALIVKQVTGADRQQGRLTLGEVPPDIFSPREDSNQQLLENEEEEDDLNYEDPTIPCCSICLEPYRVGSVVAWRRETYPDSNVMNQDIEQGQPSPSSPCVHVFHRECIVPWLENPSHDDCPSCRTILLKPSWGEEDEDLPSDNADEPEEASRSRGGRVLVLARGLASRVRRIRCNVFGQSHRGTATQEDDRQEARDAHSVFSEHTTTEMVFEIVHGLVSRVHRAGCKLIGHESRPHVDNDEIEEDIKVEQQGKGEGDGDSADEDIGSSERSSCSRSTVNGISHHEGPRLRHRVAPLQEGQQGQKEHHNQLTSSDVPQLAQRNLTRRRSVSVGGWWLRSQSREDHSQNDDDCRSTSSLKRPQSSVSVLPTLRRVFSAEPAYSSSSTFGTIDQNGAQQLDPLVSVVRPIASTSTRGSSSESVDAEVDPESGDLLLSGGDSVLWKKLRYKKRAESNDKEEWASTSGSSFASVDDGDDDPAKSGDLLLSSGDSVLWEKLRYEKTNESDSDEIPVIEESDQ